MKSAELLTSSASQRVGVRDTAYAEGVSLDWNTGALAEGLNCYRSEKFFLAHEHWESVWLRLDEPEKSFLQALIQTAAAFHHLQVANRLGAASLLRRALRRIESCPDGFGGIDAAALRKELLVWLRVLEGARAAMPRRFPQIRIEDRE